MKRGVRLHVADKLMARVQGHAVVQSCDELHEVDIETALVPLLNDVVKCQDKPRAAPSPFGSSK